MEEATRVRGMAILLDNLNCRHCGLLVHNRCQVSGDIIGNPDKYYCFHIFRNYIGKYRGGENEVDIEQQLEEIL